VTEGGGKKHSGAVLITRFSIVTRHVRTEIGGIVELLTRGRSLN